MICDICPRRCKIDRQNKIGFCGMSEKLKIAKADVFLWEEPIISGTNGCGAIFFSGCNLKCCFCQNYEISSNHFGKEISIERLIEIFKEFEEKGVHNINLVSPTQFTNQIIQALKIYKPKIPVVWNSNGYEDVETIEKLKNLVDIFLVDMKFFDENLSQKYCKAKDYFSVASKAIAKMLELKPKVEIENGVMTKGVIVRHLVMPNMTKDSLQILNWLDSNTKKNFVLSLMGQYTPYYKAVEYPEINRKLKPIEYKIVLHKAIELGFENIFYQQLESSDEKFIPVWDLKGV